MQAKPPYKFLIGQGKFIPGSPFSIINAKKKNKRGKNKRNIMT